MRKLSADKLKVRGEAWLYIPEVQCVTMKSLCVQVSRSGTSTFTETNNLNNNKCLDITVKKPGQPFLACTRGKLFLSNKVAFDLGKGIST